MWSLRVWGVGSVGLQVLTFSGTFFLLIEIFYFYILRFLAVLKILIYKDKKKKAEREKEQDDR